MLYKNKNQLNKKANKLYALWVVGCIVIFFIFLIVWLACCSPRPKISGLDDMNQLPVDSEINLKFTQPIAKDIDVEITPQVYGQVTYTDDLIGNRLSKAAVFTPELNWLPETTYQIKISNVKSVLPTFRQPQIYYLSFTTQSAPKIVEVLPKTDGEIKPDTTFTVKFNKPNEHSADYDFVFDPAMTLSAELSSDKTTYSLKPAQLLSQGGSYSLKIYKKDIRYLFGTQVIARQDEPKIAWQGQWPVREAPGIASFSPQGSAVGLHDGISVTFSENVDFDSFQANASIEPALAGSWQTSDYKTVTYQSGAFKSDTTYTVTLKQGLKTFNGGYLPEDSVHLFATVGPVKVANWSPASGSTGVSVGSGIRVTFDQAVDQGSAQSKFSISPDVAGQFSWDGLTMIFKPTADLAFNSTYEVKVALGVSSVKGFASGKDFTGSFSTELSVTKLSVPYHRQEHNLSCEAAALYMALKYRGVNVSESAIIDYIGFDPTPKKNGVWGNPHIAFVGDIDGHQPSTGYGVYWQPIAQAAQQYRQARWFTGGSLSELTAEIKKGNAVVVWGTAGTGKRIDWKTTSGENVVAVSGEHARTVIGFIGPADNPTKIITMDPLSGEKYFTKDSFLWNWGLLGNSGVVVE